MEKESKKEILAPINQNEKNHVNINLAALINVKCDITSKHPMNEEFSSIIHTSSILFKFGILVFYIRYFEITS